MCIRKKNIDILSKNENPNFTNIKIFRGFNSKY